MEAHEDANSSSSSTGESTCPVIIKRKRTKRHRALPPHPPATAASSASSGTTTEEEEDMANCLILLAQGRTAQVNEEAATTAVPVTRPGSNGLYLYSCKTCNKCFPSFQALGGHRASHKKPKMAAKEESELMSSTSKPMATLSSAGKPKTHECSICGAEFSSGQALGGHMRRHRPAIFPENSRDYKREKRGFSLDLNLPAPSDDETFGGSVGAGNPLVFSPPGTAALVDCCFY